MNIFAVLYCYPPLLVPATMCYVKLVVGLHELGHNIEVLTIKPESFDAPIENMVDRSLEKLLPKEIVNHEIWSWEASPAIKLLKKLRTGNLLFYKFLEPRKNEWKYPALKYLKGIDVDKFDIILSCSQPHCNHSIGHYLKQRTGKPWIAYFSDPWTDSAYSAYKNERIRRYNMELERKIITGADRVLFTSPEMSDLVMKKYSASVREKSGVLTHGFVPHWYSKASRETAAAKSAEIKVVQTGHFYGPRSPLPLFEALCMLNNDMNLTGKLKVDFYGNMEPVYIDFIKEHNLDCFISLNNTIPYLESLHVMKSADYLLLIDAPTKNGIESVFLPSKLVDYLGSGRPIIGITPRSGASARVLKDTGNIVCDLENSGEIANIFRKIMDGSLNVKTDGINTQRYHYRTIAENADSILRSLN